MAATGLAAGPAGASGSSTIYACYSDKTKALYYSKATAKCARGLTRISWNTQGPQGPQGARGPQGAKGKQGPQGPPGAVSGYTKSANGAFKLPPTTSGGGSPTVVDSFMPSIKASYAVNGMADGLPGSHGNLVCVDHAINSTGGSGGYTDQVSTSFGGNAALPTNGILRAGPASPIMEICRTDDTTKSGLVRRAQVTAVQLSAGHQFGPLKPANKFSLPKLRRTKTR